VKLELGKTLSEKEVVMSAIQKMRKIAEIQCNVAVLSIFFLVPISAPFILVIFSLSIHSGLSTLSMLSFWWLGVRLLIGYENISRGRVNISQTQKFWFGSLTFNAVGIISCLSNGFLGGASIFILSPAFLGCVFAIIALRIQHKSTKNLEPQIS
jgi:hypothetical protein